VTVIKWNFAKVFKLIDLGYATTDGLAA